MPAKKAQKKKKKRPARGAKKAVTRPKKAKKAPVTKEKTRKTSKKAAKTAAKGKKKVTAGKKAPSPKKIISKPEVALPAGKMIYYFGDGKAEGSGEMKDLLGGKGAGLDASTFSSLVRHDWINPHDCTAVALLAMLIIHLILHRKWIVYMTKKSFSF